MTIDELLSAAGLTANDEIPVWDAEATGEPTKKITAQQLATAVVALANLVTGVKGDAEGSYRHGNVNLTPTNIGAVNKAGDEMTGNLYLNRRAADAGSFRFGTKAGSNANYISIDQNDWGIMFYTLPVKNASSGTLRSACFIFNQFSPNSDGTRSAYNESYKLPAVDVGRTSNGNYNILTSKDAVTIPQGGTGANTAPQACDNLGAAQCILFASSDTTPALIYAKLGNLALNKPAVCRMYDATITAVSGGKITHGSFGTVLRSGTNTFYFFVNQVGGDKLFSFVSTITASSIIVGNAYQYSGTVL